MPIQPTKKPSPDDAHEFQKYIEKGFTEINKQYYLHSNVDNTKVYEDIFAHKFYKWLTGKQNFQRVLDYSIKQDLLSANLEFNKLIVSEWIAIVYPRYCVYMENPDWIKATTNATRNKAIKNIDELLTLLTSDLKMEDHEDDLNLKKLLIKTKAELNNTLPTTYPTSRRKVLPERELVMDIYKILQASIGKAPTFIILQLSSIMYEKLTEQQVRRHIKEVKAKFEQSTKPSN